MSDRETLCDFPPRTTPEQRKIIREVVEYLKSDCYERVETDEAAMAWRSPLGLTVLLSPRHDGTGWAGEYRTSTGDHVRTTSWIDVYWLDEFLP